MCTWEFRYDEELDDGFGVVQFCAETKDEAMELFTNWRKENGYIINDYLVETVYDADDAKEYDEYYRWEA